MKNTLNKLDENRYYVTSKTKLAVALLTAGVSDFVQIDKQKSTVNKVFLVFTNPKECRKFEKKYKVAEAKLLREIFRFGRD